MLAESLLQAGGHARDGKQIDQLTTASHQPRVPDRPHAQTQPDSRAPVADRGKHDGPADVTATPFGGVDDRFGRVDVVDGERLVPASVVRDDVPQFEILPACVDVPDRATSGGHEPFDVTWQIPTGSPLAKLDQPRPHLVRCGADREGAIHDSVGAFDQVVTGHGCFDLGAGRFYSVESDGADQPAHVASKRWVLEL
jgi:hypothetical protein